MKQTIFVALFSPFCLFSSIIPYFSLFFPIPGGAEDITVVDIGIPHGPDLKCRHKYV